MSKKSGPADDVTDKISQVPTDGLTNDASARLLEGIYHPPISRIDVGEISRNVYEAACQMWGNTKVSNVKFDPNDPGESVALCCLGPDWCKQIGVEQARKFGQIVLVDVVAPLYGASSTAKDKLTREPVGTLEGAALSFSAGAALRAANEIGSTLGLVANITALGFLICNQMANPAFSNRIVAITNFLTDTKTADNATLARKMRTAADVVGPMIYELGSTTVDSALGFGLAKPLAAKVGLRSMPGSGAKP